MKQNSPMDITLGTLDDVDELLELYAQVQEAVAGTDNDPLWEIGFHPSREALEQAARNSELITGHIDGRIVAALVLNAEGSPGYDDVAWTIPAKPGEFAVIHLFAIHPAWRGHGLARPFMEAALETARARGAKAIRLDTIIDNLGAQRVYDHLGFHCLGPAHLAYGPYEDNGEPNFVMYEKEL